MDLYLLRHGVAEEPARFRGDDSERPLTTEGAEMMRLQAHAMRLIIQEPIIILASPYARAKQTAAIVANAIPWAQLLEIKELSMGGSANRIIEEVSRRAPAPQVMLVGHEPELIELVCRLTGIKTESVQIKRGALLCLRILTFEPRPRAVLRWQLPPNLILTLTGGNVAAPG